jgi:hypothetical protein
LGQSSGADAGLISGPAGCYFAAMRRFCFLLTLVCLILARTVSAADGKVLKTLPQFLDTKGRASLAPSLYERDAYQARLRKHPAERAALRLAVQWKAREVDWKQMKLRAELRGVLGNSMHTTTLEIPVRKNGFFSNWSEFKIQGEDFQKFGELVAWRVTLWEGDRQLGSQQSFMWSGVAESR